MREQNCTNCRHFRRIETDTAEVELYGECRRYPPRNAVDEDGALEAPTYPVVTEDEDCGEWRGNQ